IYQEDLPLFEEKFFDSVKKQINFELEHRYLPVGETNFRYCRTVVKPYADKTKTVFYGIIQDNTVNREASLSLLNIQEEEREKISKELHDNVGQKLSASSMFFDSGGDDLPKAKKLLDESIGDIRSLSRILTTSVLGGNTFSEAVDFLLENTPNSDIISVDISVEDSSISEFVGGQLYRILQEGLNNTMKYSKATSVHIKFFEERNFMAMSLEDNGVGFNI
ncbi:MAG: histidine kinase, partial [Bacteroidota bacterium]